MNTTTKPVQLTATKCEAIVVLHVAKAKLAQIAEQIVRHYQNVVKIIRKFKKNATSRPQKLNKRDCRHFHSNRHTTLQEIINLFFLSRLKRQERGNQKVGV